MSLILFHRVLISTAILLGLVLATWAGSSYSRSGDGSDLLLAIASGVTSVVLLIYLRNLRRFLGDKKSTQRELK